MATSLSGLEALESITKILRTEFEQKLTAVQQDRDEWKEKYQELERRLQGLEEARQASGTSIIPSSDKVRHETAHPRIKENSQRIKSEPPSTISSLELDSGPLTTPSTVHGDRDSPQVLKRKYHNLDKLYKEARRQNQLLKEELESKIVQWRQWYEWYESAKEKASPARLANKPQTPRYDMTASPSISPTRNIALQREQGISDDEILDDVRSRRSETSKDAVLQPPKQQINKQASNRVPLKETTTTMDQSKEIIDLGLLALPSSRTSELAVTPTKTKQELSTPVKMVVETHEITEVPESPVVITKSISKKATEQITPLPFPLPTSSRPKSAPVEQPPRTSKATTPISTNPGAYKKRKKAREHPNMGIWTEDGTDGINPLPPSPPTGEDDGMITALLEGRLPPPPPLHFTPRNKTLGRVTELVQSENEGASSNDDSSTDRPVKRSKTTSEPRPPRRELLSPSLAAKNKGRGRYATSMDTRNADDPPRVGDFEVDPENNDGVPFAFNSPAKGRGREARRSLPAQKCEACAKFFEAHGPVDAAVMSRCTHKTGSDDLVQQVSRHRAVWPSEARFPGFWNSDFPSDEELAKQREEADKMNAERARMMAADAQSGNGRWKKKVK